MVGEVINNYEIKTLLGEGGMGTVYLAEHPFIGRRAAIKILRPDLAHDAAMVERFMNEARAANAIRHPNIIDIIDVGRTPSGVPYLMMEFLDGVPLSHRIAQMGQLDLAEALELGAQTAGALAAAHTKGIVHRDLKPDNLFLIADDSIYGRTKVKVLDFGIAKLRGDLTNVSARTQAGALMGTPPYMSPEQCRGLSDEIDHRTDVYALGIILYEMLCGAPPFMSQGWGEVVLAHLTEPPPPPRAKNPHITAAVEAVIQKALAKDRNARFATMAEFQAALRAESPGPYVGGTDPLMESRSTPPGPAGRTPARAVVVMGPTTTFRNAAAELTPSQGLTRPPRRLALVAGGAAVAALIVVAVAKFMSKGPVPETGAQTPGATAEAPASAPATTNVPPEEAPPPAVVAPPVPAPIRLRLTSEPTGASVIDASDGAVLGSTPLERQIGRSDAPLSLRLTKPGFANAELRVPRDGDFEKTVRLERARARSASMGPNSTRAPVVVPPAPTPASRPAAAEPPSVPAAAPPGPAVRRPEKW